MSKNTDKRSPGFYHLTFSRPPTRFPFRLKRTSQVAGVRPAPYKDKVAKAEKLSVKIANSTPHVTALSLADALLEHPKLWLETPNSQLGDRKPNDLIGTNEEVKVYNLLNAADWGLF